MLAHLRTAVALVQFFSHIADDALLVNSLQQEGALAWCINDDSPQQLRESLAHMTVTKALPITAIRGVQNAFALTQASSTNTSALCEQAAQQCSSSPQSTCAVYLCAFS